VPKHEILRPAGRRLKTDLKEYLLQFFKPTDIQRLELHGGRILISITAPYISRKRKNNGTVNIDNQFIGKLEKVKDSKPKLLEKLDTLTIKQLRQICELIELPIRSNASAYHIRSEIIGHFQAEKLWRGISGT